MVAECCRNLATTGAMPVAATNNLNFGNPERPEIMAQLVESVEGMADACRHFDTPITGGNVSLYNETLGEAILPTPVLGIVGLMKTAAPVPSTFRREGASVVLLGGLGKTDATRFGSTQYAKTLLGQTWGLPPALDMDYEKRVHDAMRAVAAEGLAESAHDLSDGGLAVALAEACYNGVGATLTIPSEGRADFALFHEGPSRIIVSTASPERVLEIAGQHDVEAVVIGVTMKARLQIGNGMSSWIDIPVADLSNSYESALPNLIHNTHA